MSKLKIERQKVADLRFFIHRANKDYLVCDGLRLEGKTLGKFREFAFAELFVKALKAAYVNGTLPPDTDERVT